MTIPEIVRLIETQTSGKFVASDFVPVPCCFPTCNSVTYAFIEGDKVTPLPRIVDVGDYLDYITNRIVPDFSRDVRTALEGLWSSSSVAGSDTSHRQVAISCQACELPDGLAINNIAQNMIMIMLQDFMDPWTFNQKNLMKCCKEFLLPGASRSRSAHTIPSATASRRVSNSTPWSRNGGGPERKDAVTNPGRSSSISASESLDEQPRMATGGGSSRTLVHNPQTVLRGCVRP
jgi:uncharacterized radical SAM superfamily Fe-S cluster-containing enzyme